MTTEAKSLFSLLRDEFERTRQMPLLKRYREMERIIELFTAEDVIHKLLVLTRDVDKDGVMLSHPMETPQDINCSNNEFNRRCTYEENFSMERKSTDVAIKSRSKYINAPYGCSYSTANIGPSCPDVQSEIHESDQASQNILSTQKRQRSGILQNVIKGDEIPEFLIPPQLSNRRNFGKQHTYGPTSQRLGQNGNIFTTDEAKKTTYTSLPNPFNSYLQDSAALPGFFINTDISFESLNIESLCGNVTDGVINECQIPRSRRGSALSIWQEKHLQDLDLAFLNSFPGDGRAGSPQPGRMIRIFVFEQFLYLRNEYRKLKGKNVLIRYKKMSDMLENCSKSCVQLKM
ncbi:hypothetical protein PoB_006337200 [Plakobranchus ocellatus]|uniref:Uncharacterized protein n=1 Tax=Plakobranchus ocellatus TaxID=259542 RepID=A0AAV4CY83_9GAST|nr:hypothetical protein PoB_006337200 [Plakobranchus ocellatus]